MVNKPSVFEPLKNTAYHLKQNEAEIELMGNKIRTAAANRLKRKTLLSVLCELRIFMFQIFSNLLIFANLNGNKI